MEVRMDKTMHSDGQGDHNCGVIDDMIYQHTHATNIMCELDKEAAPAFEMKQVFLYLQKQMKEEVISQCSFDAELLQTLEKDKAMLVEQIKYLQLQHEDELNKFKETLSQKYEADIDKYREKCLLLQNCVESFRVHSRSTCVELKMTQTESNDAEVCCQFVSESSHMLARDAEVQCEECNFSMMNELYQMYHELGIKCEKLKSRLELSMDELEMALDREGEAQERLIAIEGKYNTLKLCLSPKTLLGGKNFLEVIEDNESKCLFPHEEKHEGMHEGMHISREYFSELQSKYSEFKERLSAAQLTNCELVIALENAESSQMSYRKRSEDIEQLHHELEERFSMENKMHQQQMEALELYWKNQVEHVRTQQPAELSASCCQITDLEKTIKDLQCRHTEKSLVPSDRFKHNDVITNGTLITDLKLSKAVKLSNECEGQQYAAHQTCVEQLFRDSASLIADRESLLEECTHLMEKKKHLEEEVVVLELEWASLEGYLSSHRSQLVTTQFENILKAEIHHGPNSYSSISSAADGDAENQNTSLEVTNMESVDLPDDEIICPADDNCQEFVGGRTLQPECGCTSEKETMHVLNLKLRLLEERCRYLEEASSYQSTKADNVTKKMKCQHKHELNGLKDMLVQAQKLMQQRRADYETQLKKADTLVKVLYVENAQVMEALQVTEERQRKCELLNVRLQEKCQALTHLVSEIYKTAIS